MDYSNLRKILLILCIISVILSISRKVFATDLVTDNTYLVKSYNQNITLPDAFKDNSRYWFVYISNNTSAFNGCLIKVFYSDTRFNVNIVNNSYVIPTFTGKYKTYQSTGPSKSLSQIQSTINAYDFDLSNTSSTTITNFNLLPSNWNAGGILASNFTITNSNDEITIPMTNSNIVKPHFINPQTDFDNLTFDDLFVSLGTYDKEYTFYLKILELTKTDENSDPSQNVYYYNNLSFTLNDKSSFLEQMQGFDSYYYAIPDNALKLKKDTTYYFILTSSPDPINNSTGEITESDTIFDVVLVDTQDKITTQQEILNSIINDNPSDNTDDTISNNLPRPGYERWRRV